MPSPQSQMQRARAAASSPRLPVSLPVQWLLPWHVPEGSEGRRARQGRDHSSKEDKDAGIGGDPPLPKLLLGVYWAGIKQPGRVGSAPLCPAAGAPPARLPCRASASGTESVASSGGAEGVTGATWGPRGVRSCHQTGGSALPSLRSEPARGTHTQ